MQTTIVFRVSGLGCTGIYESISTSVGIYRGIEGLGFWI